MKIAERVLTVTLNPVLDKIIKVNHFERGREHHSKEMRYSAGGKGINVSRALMRFGIPALATGFLGGVSGDALAQMLREERILSDFIQIKGETRTNLTILGSTSSITRILEDGPRIKKEELKGFLKKVEKLLRNCSHVVFSGRNIPGAGVDIYRRLVTFTQKNGKRTVLDTSGEELQVALSAKPFLIKPNLSETESILKKKLKTLAQFEQALLDLRRLGAQNVILSLDKKGAIATDGKETWLVQPPVQKVVNTVGCGDALVAGFLAAQIQGKNFLESLQWAVAAGTGNVTSLHPGEFSMSRLRMIKKKLKIQRVA
ncbi:MAG: 1-phosphofructokinase family hexose kinase [Candidatus Omnitrophica bacterium]|nr:1-phosphofructokinase family hexose kinase [Candidatus Omnitrophota bacterium]